MTIKNGIIMDQQISERVMQGPSVQHERQLTALSVVTFILMLLVSWGAQAVDLESVDYQTTSSSQSRLILNFSATAPEPNTFSMDDPARIVLDFAGVKNKLDEKNQQINVGLTRSIATVEAGERTRMVISMARPVPYTVDVSGNTVVVMLETGSATATTSTAPSRTAAGTGRTVTDIDFRRGEMGEARVLIHLSDDGAAVDIRRQRHNEVVVDLVGVSLPDNLQRRLDVIDFATPVQFIQSTAEGSNTRMLLTTTGEFEHLAYQSDKLLVVEVKPVVETDTDGVVMPGVGADEGYTGEKLSLNFQNIEVRAVLQLLAEFTGMNLVTSDTVQGSLTLRLRDVPWDQALDIILKTKGLDKRINGNVMLVAPAAEILARERQELEARRQLVDLEPLFSDFIEISFAKASDIAGILQSSSQQSGASERTGFLSERGSVTVDERTNSLLIRDTSSQLSEIRRFIDRLDIPVRQVLIESRIVIANNDFTRELGVRFGASARSRTLGAGTDGSLRGMQVDSDNRNLINPSRGAGTQLGNTNNLNINLPVTEPAGQVALALAKLPLGMILELELSAMQAEGKGEIISSPRVVTSNQSQATIEQGTEIPYQEASSSGATAVSFKQATLKLDVTPQITPDDRIVMDLEVNKDEVGEIFQGVPSVDTRSVKTQVLVDNGETVVLGGIYEQISITNTERVPFFGDLPYVGFMFRNNLNEDRRRELLVFVTPKIIQEGMDF